MKRLLFALTTFLSLIVVHGQTTFGRSYGTGNNDYGNTVTKTFDNGYIIGTHYNDGQWGIIKTNSQGDTTWIKTYPFLTSTNPSLAFESSIIQTSDSNYVFIGALPDSNSFILKVNSVGDTLWLKKSGFGPYPVSYSKVVEDNSGNLIIVGSLEILTSVCCSPLMVKTNSYGNIIPTWNPSIPCPSSNGCRLTEIFVDIDGNYLVSGDAPSPNVPSPRLTKVDTAGNIVWNKYYSITDASISGITQSPDSGYVLTGPNWDGDDSTYLFKTDKNGNLQWLKKYKETTIGWQSIAIDTTNGGYLISGTNGNICLMKIDANYNFLWMNEFGGPLNEYFAQMKSTSDGGCVIVGSTQGYGAGDYDVYLIKPDQNGQAIGLNEIESNKYIFIYPNPFSTQVTLQTDDFLNNATLTVCNSFGQKVKQINNISGKTVTLQRGSLTNGFYFLHLAQDGKTFSVAKILIID